MNVEATPNVHFIISYQIQYNQGMAVAQLVEALRYKSEGRGFFIDIILLAALWPWGRLSL